jgi:hypothetical protein
MFPDVLVDSARLLRLNIIEKTVFLDYLVFVLKKGADPFFDFCSCLHVEEIRNLSRGISTTP